MTTDGKKKRIRITKAEPISEQAFLELQSKYGIAVHELRKMARELNVARPRLEMHLIVLQREKGKGK